MDSRRIILLLTVSLSCNLVQSSDDFLSQLLMNTGENGSSAIAITAIFDSLSVGQRAPV